MPTARLHPCLVLALVLGAAACAVPRETLRGTDAKTFVGGALLDWEIDSQPATAESSDSSRTLAELSVWRSSSSFSQQVTGGSAIDIGGASFYGTDPPIAVEFDLLRLAALFRHGRQSSNGAGFEFLFGLSYSQLGLSGSTATKSGSDEIYGVGPLLGLGLFYEPRSWVRLFLEGSINPTVSWPTVSAYGRVAFDEPANLDTLDIGLRLRLDEHAALRVSWRRQVYKARYGYTSDLDLRAAGPALALCFSL